MADCRAIKNECKIKILSEFLIKIPSRKENISYRLVLLIMHDCDSLDFTTVMFLMPNQEYCGTTMMMKSLKLLIFKEGVYTSEIHKKNITKKKVMSVS